MRCAHETVQIIKYTLSTDHWSSPLKVSAVGGYATAKKLTQIIKFTLSTDHWSSPLKVSATGGYATATKLTQSPFSAGAGKEGQLGQPVMSAVLRP